MSGLVLVLVLAAVLTVAGMAGIARQRIRAHGFARLAWRWLTGEAWHGQAITDAGWTRPGTRALTATGHARRWWYLPRARRAAHRSGLTLGALITVWGLMFARTPTLLALAAATVAGTGFGAWRAAVWQQRRRHRRMWVEPAHLAAASLAGIPAAVAASSWLTVAPDRSRVVAELPPGANPDGPARNRLAGTLAGKLGIEAPEVRWQLAGPKPRLELTRSAPPPARVTLADARAAIGAARPDELVWGLGKRGQVVKTSLSGDSPHVGLSMGSGAGKSVTARSLLAQMLHRGAVGLILDVKWISHMWAAGLPNVAIARRPEEIHAALLWLGREIARRNEVALAGADLDGNVHAAVGPRLIVIAEELNATASALRAHWKGIREKGDPARSPALDALDGASFMGRQVLCNIVYIGQRLSVRATGSGDARENIGVLCFGRYSASNWRMLAGDHPMPQKSLAPGRVQIVTGSVREAQGIYMAAAEARELALAGAVSPLPAGMPGGPHATGETASQQTLRTGPELESATGTGPVPLLPASGAVTLSEAVEAGLLGGLTLAGVRTARHRDKTFPKPVGRSGIAHMYEPMALASWAASRKK